MNDSFDWEYSDNYDLPTRSDVERWQEEKRESEQLDKEDFSYSVPF